MCFQETKKKKRERKKTKKCESYKRQNGFRFDLNFPFKFIYYQFVKLKAGKLDNNIVRTAKMMPIKTLCKTFLSLINIKQVIISLHSLIPNNHKLTPLLDNLLVS